MFPSFVPLAAAAELLAAAEAVPEDPPPQANKKVTPKIKKIFFNIEFSQKKILIFFKITLILKKINTF